MNSLIKLFSRKKRSIDERLAPIAVGFPDYYLPQYPTELEVPMVSEEIYKLKSKEKYPTTTSSFNGEYHAMWCGYTKTDIMKEEKDPRILDHLPLKYYLTKMFPWILDVTEVRVKMKIMTDSKPIGPLEIHLTVSPAHASELMTPSIEKKVRERLYKDLIPLITCMYENNNGDKPLIIFSPLPTETILQYM